MNGSKINISLNFNHIKIEHKTMKQHKQKALHQNYAPEIPPTNQIETPKNFAHSHLEIENSGQHHYDFIRIVGFLCLLSGSVFFILTIFSLFVAKLMPATENVLLEFLRTDQYFCFLVPMLLPSILLGSYLNWFCMKIFRHS